MPKKSISNGALRSPKVTMFFFPTPEGHIFASFWATFQGSQKIFSDMDWPCCDGHCGVKTNLITQLGN